MVGERETRGGVSRLFHTFANAVLARTLPSVRAWLVSKLDERASIEGMEIYGPRVILLDAKLPIGPTAILEVERAVFAASADDLAAGRPPLRMESMSGRLIVPGDEEGALRFEAPIELEGLPPESGLEWVHGIAKVDGARWTASMGRDAQAPIVGQIRVRVTSSEWELADGEATAADATIRIAASGRLDDPERAVERARLATEDARVGHYLDALFALAGRELTLPVPLPYTGKVDGEIALEADGALRADLELTTEASTLGVHARGDRAAGTIERGRLEGKLDWADLLPEAVAARVDLERSDPPELEGTLSGELTAPALDARLTASALALSHDDRTLALEDLQATATGEGIELGFRLGAGVGRASLGRGEPPRLSLQHLDAPAAVELIAIAGAGSALRLASADPEEAIFALPDDATLELSGSYEEGALRGHMEVATPRSRLHLSPLVIATEDGALDGTAIKGSLASADALDAGLFPGPIRVDRQGAAQLDARLIGAGADTALEGRLTSASLGWKFRAREDLPPVVLSAAASDLRVDGEAVTLTGLEGNLFGGRAEMDLRITYVGETPIGRVLVTDAKEGLGKWVGAALYGDRGLAGLRGDLELETDEAGAMVGPLRLRTSGSTLDVAARIAPDGAVDGTTARGELSLGDLYELIPRGGPTLVGKGALAVDATLEGPFTSPGAELKIHGERLVLLVAGAGFDGVKVAIDRVLARMHGSLDRIVWRELAIDAFDGRLSSQGLFGWGEGFAGLQAKLELDDVDLGRLPSSGGGELRDHLGGRLNATLSVKKKKGARLSAKGELWIAEPRYPMLRLAAESLAKVGLKPPPPRGTEPLMADLRGGPEGWLLKGISGAVRGARCDGDLALRPDGTVFGKVVVVAEAVWLRSSTLLNLPAAALGDVTIPVAVLGTLAHPEFEADVLEAFDHLVAKSRIGRGVQAAVDRVMDGLGAAARRYEGEDEWDDASHLETDVLIHRIATGEGDEDAYLGVLIDRGLSPDEIATRIERAREG